MLKVKGIFKEVICHITSPVIFMQWNGSKIRAMGIAVITGLAGAPLSSQVVTHTPVQVGTKLNVTLLDSLSTQYTKKGQKLNLRVDDSVMIDGKAVINKGAKIWGQVADVKKAGRFNSDGRLMVNIDSVELSNGQTVRLVANSYGIFQDDEEDEEGNKRSGNQVLNQLPGADIATGFFKKGDVIEIPPNSKIPVFTASYEVITVIDTTAGASLSDEWDEDADQSPKAMTFAMLAGLESWGRGLGAMAANRGSTMELRALGEKMLVEHAKLHQALKDLANKERVPLPPLNPSDRAQLNKDLEDFRTIKADDFDDKITDKIAGLSTGVLNYLEEVDGPEIEDILLEFHKVWADQLAAVSKLSGNASKKSKR